MEQFRVEQCRRCGAVVQRISTQNASHLVEDKPELIRESKHGTDVGFTRSGRLIRGFYGTEDEPNTSGYEVHRKHECTGHALRAAAGGRR